MELQDLKTQWANHDRKLDTSIQLSAALLRESGLNHTKSYLQRLVPGLLIELLLNLAAVAMLGLFLVDHLWEMRFFAPAAVLDLGAILLVIAGVHQWVALKSIDYSAPVVSIQRKLEGLKIQRIQATKWTLLFAPLLWTPLLIVTLKGAFGVNIYEVSDGKWLAANLLFGVGVTALMVWVSKRYAGRFQRSPLVQRLMNDIAGRSLNKAAAFLDRLSNFEQDGEQT